MAAPMVFMRGTFRASANPKSWLPRSKTWCFVRHYASGGKKRKSLDKGLLENAEIRQRSNSNVRLDGYNSHNDGKAKTQTKSFKDILRNGYDEARKSVIVRTNQAESSLQSLSQFGKVTTAFHATPEKQFLLTEYARETSVFHLLDNSTFFLKENQFPMRSRCLYDQRNTVQVGRRTFKNFTSIRDDCLHDQGMNEYPMEKSLDQELIQLCQSRSLNELDLRLRFLICYLIEEAFQSVLPHCRVIPYGSCLNGFGWWNSDLDMMLCLHGDPYSYKNQNINSMRSRDGANFKFVTEVFGTERHLSQMTLTMVAAMLKLLPRVSDVHKILNARVPIVRFVHNILRMQCDISLQAMDSIKMTELLYLLSSSDSRIRPLMSGIKQWAISHGLTSSGEQQKPTTIGLLCLLIFYLQSLSPPVLPTLREIQKMATGVDSRFHIGDVVYAFPSHPGFIPKSENTQSLEDLLHGFFTFYADFDFSSKSISLIEGEAFPKQSDGGAVYVENPLSIGLNICKNVSQANLDMLRETMRESARIVEELSSRKTSDKSRLSTLFNVNANSGSSAVVFLSELFDDVPKEETESLSDSEQLIDHNEVFEKLENISHADQTLCNPSSPSAELNETSSVNVTTVESENSLQSGKLDPSETNSNSTSDHIVKRGESNSK